MTGGEFLVVLGMAFAAYAPKALPLVAVSEHLTSRLRTWLTYVAPAVLGALVAPSLFAPVGPSAAPGWDEAGYVAAFVLALWTRKMVPALAAGLATLVVVTFLRH